MDRFSRDLVKIAIDNASDADLVRLVEESMLKMRRRGTTSPEMASFLAEMIEGLRTEITKGGRLQVLYREGLRDPELRAAVLGHL